jgi:hypothetical protein
VLVLRVLVFHTSWCELTMVRGKTQNVIWSTRCKRGSRYEETLALQAGTCSDLWYIHQKKCKEWQKGGSLVTDGWWNQYTWVQGIILYKVYNYHDSWACGYKWSVILPRIEGMIMEWFGYRMVLVCLQLWHGIGSRWFWYSFGKLCDL